MSSTGGLRLGFFTRVLDEGSAAERYRCALAQIRHAEGQGFDSAWVAQHHFHEGEGGLPSPFVFLAQVAALTTRIRLGTGIVTLPMELPIRVAEDAIVLDLISGGRLELGVGSGGNPEAFAAFGLKDADRQTIFAEKLAELTDALDGKPLQSGDRLYPQHSALLERLWYAAFSIEGARAAGQLGAGLLLSRSQPRTKEAPDATLAEIQDPMVDAYLAALPAGVAPRILVSRSVFVADRREDALRFADLGLHRHHAPPSRALGRRRPCANSAPDAGGAGTAPGRASRHGRGGDRLPAPRPRARSRDRTRSAGAFGRPAPPFCAALHRAGGAGRRPRLRLATVHRRDSPRRVSRARILQP